MKPHNLRQMKNNPTFLLQAIEIKCGIVLHQKVLISYDPRKKGTQSL